MTTLEPVTFPPEVAQRRGETRLPPSPLLLSNKVQGRHLDRMAVVYVRQSSARQVVENRESTRLQYGLRERAIALGWPSTRVLVIDEDLGQSGQSIAGRPGFQRLLAEVGLDHVGIILGIEMSRLARSCRDWHQLLELCAIFGTLIGDADGVFDPCEYNDRLLLGLKGTMSEAELHILQGRLRAGQRNKARRGELFSHAPVGYVRSDASGLILEPDEQARGVVQLIFDKFSELGSASAVLRYLVHHQIRVGVREHRGPQRGQLLWRRPNSATLQAMLHHPTYAGAYVHGRRRTDPRKQVPGRRGSGRAWAAPEDWEVLIRDQLPAYIGWEQYQANQQRLRDNSSKYGRGAPRDGCIILAGLAVCGHCGRRMSINYADRSHARFTCDGARNHFGAPQCQALSARPLETLVTRQLLIALEPASLELSLAAADQIEAERQRLDEQQRQSVERARYEAERAWRQYTAVEPENRLVARELERRWDAALGEQRRAEEALNRFRAAQPTRLSEAEREQIRGLARCVPDLWNAASTKPSERQTIARQLIDRVAVTVIGRTERVEVTIHWAGSYQSSHELLRPIASYRNLQDGDGVLARVIELKQQGLSHAAVARRLTAESFRTPQGGPFTVPIVTFLCRRAREQGRLPQHPAPEGYWQGCNLARHLDIPAATLSTWRRRGWITACRKGGRWVYWANSAELDRLSRLRNHPRALMTGVPADLTTPRSEPPCSENTSHQVDQTIEYSNQARKTTQSMNKNAER
jgi:DNA invertase Pin-like site-specific DNA recombinase